MGLLCLLLIYFVRNWTEKRINFYLGQVNSGLERIAQIKTRTNDVTRNHTGQLLWQSIDSGEVVFIGNSIQTEKNSVAEIIFDDGEQITIGPHSLVRFVKSENKILMQLVSGKIEIKSPDAEFQKELGLPASQPKRLFVATPKGRLVLNNSNIRIESKNSKEPDSFKIEVVSGAPELIRSGKIEVLQVSPPSEKIEILAPPKPPVVVVPVVETPPPPVETAAVVTPEPVVEAPAPVAETPAVVEPPRQPAAQTPLKSPKVKSIKVEADE